jgi:acyl transferase domain-containing protein/NAD(P)-dependent dehydrogenase (short-subunit alcohol dehydrogenase family)/acyl-CoA thioesterase FadM
MIARCFAVPYQIQFSDTMAYGSHHFLTNFRFQCFAREKLLFGPAFSDEGSGPYRQALDRILLLTLEGYTRNFAPALLGERLWILTSFSDRGLTSLRFCFRVLTESGQPVTAGYQTVVCADKATQAVIPFPDALSSLISQSDGAIEQDFVPKLMAGGSSLQSDLFPEGLRSAVRSWKTIYEASGFGRWMEPAQKALDPRIQGATVHLHPGQGSFDWEAFARLREEEPEYASWKEALQRVHAEEFGVPLPSDPQQSLEWDQIIIYLSNLMSAREARRHGASPGAIVGHSFGEISALVEAGALSFEDGLRVVWRRSKALSRKAARLGTLLAVHAPRDRIEAELPPSISIAGTNHDRQVVLAGSEVALDRLSAVLSAKGIGSSRIDSRYPFHSSAMREAAEAFAASLEAIPFAAPKTPVYSPIENRFYPDDPRFIRESLASHLVKPFDFGRALIALQSAGAKHWVALGGRPILGDIARKTLSAEASPTSWKELGKGLGKELGKAPAPETPKPPGAPAHARPASNEELGSASAVAVVSLGCMLPGSSDPESYWAQMLERRSGVVDMRSIDPDFERDFMQELDSGAPKTYSALAGRVDNAAIQRAPECPEGDWASWTRYQKLLALALAQTWRSLPDALKTLDSGRTEVLIGSTADGCEELDLAHLRSRSQAAGLGLERQAAQAVASVTGIQATTLLLDAACASSLFTVGLGMARLHRREADLVVAGGAFAPGAGNSCLFSQFKGLTAKGIRPFDRGADGVVFGEGAAFLALCRLEDALRLGLPVHAVIRSVGLSSDGKSSSANVPQRAGQKLAIERAYRAAGISPDTIQWIEAHGTATPKGDDTELQSISEFFAGRARPLEIQSIKALLGHTGWTAGAASLIKVCLALRHGKIPGQGAFEAPSAALSAAMASAGLRVSREDLAWKREGRLPRRAGVNGFGFGGTNAHALIEEFVPEYHQAVAAQARAESEARKLVRVAASRVAPPSGGFHRDSGSLPPQIRMIPDLLESLDPAQRLAVELSSAALDSLPGWKASSQSIGVVFATPGKGRAGLDANWAAHADRLRRIAGAGAASRIPSDLPGAHKVGPYSLQGMMPNIVSGRVSNLLDLQGANFVLDTDAGLPATRRWVSALLDEGHSLVLAGAIRALGDSEDYAEAVAVTTDAIARSQGWPILGDYAVEDASASPATVPTQGFDERSRIEDLEPLWMPAPAKTSGSSPAAGDIVWVIAPSERSQALADQVRMAPDLDPGVQVVALAMERIPESPPTEIPQWVVSVSEPKSSELLKEYGSWVGGIEWLRKLYSRIEAGTTRWIHVSLGGVDEEGVLEPATGFWAGSLKSLQRELPGARVRAVVTESEGIAPILPALWGESATPSPVESWLRADGRRLERWLCKRAPKPRQTSSLALGPSSVVLLTGGARGVTAVMAEALLTRHGCRAVLLGRSSIETNETRDEQTFYAEERLKRPGIKMLDLKREWERAESAREARETFDRLAAIARSRGGECLYRAVDLRDARQVDQLMQEVARLWGRLDLIVHGAGVQYSRKLHKRSPEELRATVETKVHGWLKLRESSKRVFERSVPIHALSSAFSFYGNDGQADYGAANEVLDRLTAALRAQELDVPHTSLGWLAWNRIGMTKKSEFETLGGSRQLRGVNADEGGQLFLDLLDNDGDRAIHTLATASELKFYSLPHAEERAVSLAFSPDLHPEALEHRVDGSPVVPGARLLDRVASVVRETLGWERVSAIEKIRLHRFVKLEEGGGASPAEFRLRLLPLGPNQVYARLERDLVHASGRTLRAGALFFEALLQSEPSTASPAPLLRDVATEPDARIAQDAYMAPGSSVALSGRFRCLEGIRISSRGRSALTRTTATSDALPWLAIDASWRLSVMEADPEWEPAGYVPVALDRVTLAPGAETALGELTLRSTPPRVPRGERHVVIDRVEILSEDGRCLVVWTGVKAHKVGKPRAP